MDLRRVAFWVVVLGLVAWVISNPGGAGHTASHLVLQLVGAGRAVVSAVVSFVSSL